VQELVELRKQIEQLTYNLYLRRGKTAGHALDDWLAAEREILESTAISPAPKHKKRII